VLSQVATTPRNVFADSRIRSWTKILDQMGPSRDAAVRGLLVQDAAGILHARTGPGAAPPCWTLRIVFPRPKAQPSVRLTPAPNPG